MSSESQTQTVNHTSRPSSSKFAILMETNGDEFESWYNFIRYDGNEEALQHLQKQLEKVDFYVIDDMSTFDLDLDHLVSEETAREMCTVDLNAFMFHRKFNGKLKKIDFGFSRKDENEDRIEKVHEKIGFGDIDKYVDGEEEFKDDNDSLSDDSDDSYSDHSYSDHSDDSDDSDDSDNDSKSRSPSPSPPPAPKKKKEKTSSKATNSKKC